MGCQPCNSIGGLVDLDVNVNYPPDKVKEGDPFNISVNLTFTGPHVGTGTFQICIYETGQLVKSESFNFSWAGYNETVSKTYIFYMGSRNMNFNVSIIDVGLVYDTCENFAVFTVYRTIPPVVVPTKYNCVQGVCQGPVIDGTFNSLADCTASGCRTPVPVGGVTCPADKINLFGTCYKTSNVAIVAGTAIVLMILMRK